MITINSHFAFSGINNKIANLITKFITNIPTIGQFDPSRSQRPNKDFIPIIELVNLNYQ